MQALVRFATEADLDKSELCAGLDAAGALVIERLMNVCLRQKVACQSRMLRDALLFSCSVAGD